ncbi:hypothetical protein NM208_g8957 [Fusarium decemcellulare]|uniref:Uncharacterized protein n=1 Tax=Fusarium decemcellulare TaxID=57161 RepID=A0ACC1S3C4_9HYPO|nr:hypothetical protein NM208_g8957 [Fusarium decemcellulare]
MADGFPIRRARPVPKDSVNDAGSSPGQGRGMPTADIPTPKGMELRLTGVPNHMSAYDLQLGLSRKHLRTECAFLVILEKSTEEIFWESLDPVLKDRNKTARVIVPNQSDGSNPADALVDKTIKIRCCDLHEGGRVALQAEKIRKSETPNHKYEELHNTELSIEQPLGLLNGHVADVYKVSCGTFNGGKFDVAHTWSYGRESEFRKLSYFGDARPPRFRVCLPDNALAEWEWMDIHELNIQGLVFERPESRQLHRVVYFVLDKPPQFYKRPKGSTRASIAARISHPSTLQRHTDEDLDVCRVPWIIQYCRVFKVEYSSHQDFNPDSAWPIIQKEQRNPWSCFEDPGIPQSKRTAADMAKTLRSNLEHVSRIFPSHLTGCQLGVAKLFYNCSIPATSPATKDFLNQIVSEGLPQHSRQFSEKLHRMFERTGTSHSRALEVFHQFHDIDNPYGLYENGRSDGYFPVYSDMDNLVFELMQENGNSSSGVFDVVVHPSHVEIQGPIDPPTNSITDQYRDIIERFLRVRFVDNNTRPLRAEPGVSLKEILRRLSQVLAGRGQLFPLLPDLTGFEFLGYSMSGLKKRKAVWFFQRQDGLDATAIRARIGDWDVKSNPKLANDPSKWGARISLAFTESRRVLSLSRGDWEIRDDVGDHPDFPNTDGCGLISPELCDAINGALAPYNFTSSRAFQIRFGGVKGVVYAGANSLLEHDGAPLSLLMRKSQLKLRVPDPSCLDLRIVSTAGDGRPSLFLASALKAFEDSGANTAEIERIYEEAYTSLKTASSNGVDLLQQIHTIPYSLKEDSMKGRLNFLKLAIRLKKHGIHPSDYPHTFLADYLTRLAAKAREKDLFKIPIPGSFSLLGLTDDYRVLKPKEFKSGVLMPEVFIRAHGETIEGPVLIYRDPIIHIGDIQEAEAIGENELKRRLTKGWVDGADRAHALLQMDNVIFFSQEDNPPLPNRLSGGDLDGDRFEVLTKGCRFWGDAYKTTSPDCYTEDGPPAATGQAPPKTDLDQKSFDIGQLAEFITQYIRNDCFAELEHRLLALADKKANGMNDADVKDLAQWLSQAVDYAKSGKAVDLVADVFKNPKFKVSESPDFLRALGRRGAIDSGTGFYQSSNLLGRLYRKFEGIPYNFVSRLDNRSLIDKLAKAWPVEDKQDTLSQRDGVLYSDNDLRQFRGKLNGHMESYGWDLVKATTSRNGYEELFQKDTAELDLFLGKQQSDFATKHVQDLMQLISEFFVDRNIVAWSRMVPPRVRPRAGYDRNTVKAMYKQYLYTAWKHSIINRGHVKDFGTHGHAYLCLYALYCEDLPIDT